MNFEKSTNEAASATEFEIMLEKCYVYANKQDATFPEGYRANYDRITQGIEDMDCTENVRAVMRGRYRYGYKFTDIARILGITYQWVYELHKNGVSFLEKHLFA